MIASDDRLPAALAAIDEANAADPTTITLAGETGPRELIHGRRVSHWLARLDTDADEAQQLAARAHHFRRWTRPRADYPAGRPGYLRWRRDAKAAHSAEVASLLGEQGYDDETIERVGRLIRKERLAADPHARTHEDALCLVFLEDQLEDLTDQVGDDHMVEILVKTLAKMSPEGIALAAGLDLAPRGATLLGRAVEESSP